MILHTINKPGALAQCSELIAPDDIVVLIENGIYLALDELPFDARVLADDAEARGMRHRLVGDTGQISYDELVALVVEAEKVCAWF